MTNRRSSPPPRGQGTPPPAHAPNAQKPRLWRVLVLGALVLALLLAVLSLVAQRSFARLSAANDWNLHTYQVLSKIDRASQVLDAHEAQLRGFALTGDAKYLAQLQSTGGEGVRALREVRALTADRLQQQQRLDTIEPSLLDYNRRFVNAFLGAAPDAPTAPDELARARQLAGAQTPARSQRTANLQRELRAMESTERHLLSARATELQLAETDASRVFLAGGAFTLLLAGALLLFLGSSIGAQQRASAQLGALNDSLVAEVSERRTAEESLRASEAGFRHLAEDSLDLICRHAPDGTLTYVSPAARPLLGYSPLEMNGVHFWRFLTRAPAPNPGLSPAQRFGALLHKTQTKPLLQSFRAANGREVWLETVGHSIVDPDSGEVRAWHTTSRDVSARVHDERERARLLDGLRAVVEIADELIAAPNEAALLQLAVIRARARLGLGRCSIYLADANLEPGLMRGTWGTDENGGAAREDTLFYDTRAEPNADDARPNPGERWIVRHNQIRHLWRDGERVELPGRGWIARTLIATRSEVIGLFFHDGVPGDDPHDAVGQELVAVFCSLLGALLESTRTRAHMTAQQKLLETIVENAPVFLYSVDKSERFTLANGTVLGQIGLDKTKMIGREITEVMGAGSVSVALVRRALAGESFEMEMAYAGRWLKMWRQPLRDESGQISGMIGLGMDMTAQHQTALELRASETRYREVADSLQEVLFQTDARDCWSFLNPAWTEITGQPIGESLGQNAAAALHPDDRQAFEALLTAMRENVQVPAQILRFVRREGFAASQHDFAASQNGVACVDNAGSQAGRDINLSESEVRWIEIALRANFDGEGEFRGTAGTLSDVSQRVRAENALRETLEMQRAILQGATYAIVATDAQGIIQSFNPAAEAMFGVAAREVVGRATPAIFHDAAELSARAAQLERELGETIAPDFEVLVARARFSGGSDEAEWTCLRADGGAFPMRISHSVLRGENGQIAGYVSIGYDLSETRRAQQFKDEFVSVVSHELRTPLTSIRGALGLLSGGVAGVLPPAAEQMIEIAEKNADRLVLLINDILDIEKIASGKMRFEMREISLPELLANALESNRGYAHTLGVELELEPLALGLQNAILRGDEARLQQVLSNLISNACKWTPAGSAVRLRARLGANAGQTVRIEVQDAGPGVPPEFVPRLFERFSQADGSATRGKGGTGLGLAVTLAIIETHGGEIGYLAPDLSVGRVGASFYFDLPAENLAPPKPARGRMLVVEDDAEVAEVLRAILEDAGYNVEVAASCAAALTRAQSGAFSGATLDLHLPDGNGLELLEQLRALPQTRELPVVIVSSFCEESQDFGITDVKSWLSKPVEPGQLLRALAGLGGHKARVLHVEDDPDIRRLTALILSDSSEVTFASTLAQGRARLKAEPFDLVILDIGLPDGNGLELLETLEFLSQPIPVVLFSAREEEAETASKVAAALIKSRTPNEALRAKVEELLEARAA